LKERRHVLVSIVIPVYNSPVLEELAGRIDAVFRELPEDDYELILVDDGSPVPETWRTLERLARERPRVRAIQLSRNFGQQAATLCGLKEARGEVVITLDDDLQHLPEDIPRLLELRGRDIVIGQLGEKHHSWARRAASRVKGYFDHLLIGKPREIQLSSYRLLGRTVVDGVLAIRTPNPFLPAMMFHVSKDIAAVAVRHASRRQGRSGYSLRKLLRVFSNLVFNNSSLLLRLVGEVGIVLSFLSFLAAGAVVYRKLVHAIALQGWASLFTALLFIGGLLLFGLGVVGEYLVRIIESSEAKPTYFVRRRVE
jgi:dolichol-phosphate mannosyltransferase/undecaprenyl-phosphate 4-deoxy-4-formamido-L-arabinose transferase